MRIDPPTARRHGPDRHRVRAYGAREDAATGQSSVDWTKAADEATTFICTIIEAALANADEVFVYYVIGNHDESMTWMFARGLAWKYPQAVFDLEIAERKVHRWFKVAIGMTHGDARNRKDMDRVFVDEFPRFASATVREGHLATSTTR